nr:hypothetical protein [uncultured Treponema sp.]
MGKTFVKAAIRENALSCYLAELQEDAEDAVYAEKACFGLP